MKRSAIVLSILFAFGLGLSLGPLLRRDVSAQPITSMPPMAEVAAPAGWGRAVGYSIGPSGGTILFEAADGTLRQWVIALGTASHVIRRN